MPSIVSQRVGQMSVLSKGRLFNNFRLDSSTRQLIAVWPPDAAFLIQPLGVGAGRGRYLRRRP